jgi:hypothetical protein
MHVALLGDSIFDNKSYVNWGEPDVVTQLNALLATGDKTSLIAIDGDTTRGIESQFRQVPSAISHVIVSVGGNDALGQLGLLSKSVKSVSEAVWMIAETQHAFEQNYRKAVAVLASLKRPTVLCTIYNPRYAEPVQQTVAMTALSIYNDVIIRAATEQGWPLLDLRLICTIMPIPLSLRQLAGQKLRRLF